MVNAVPDTGRRTRGSRKQHREEPDPLAAKVGARIRQLRDECEISFDAFVEEAEIGRGHLSELERGLVVPTLSTLAKLARALEIELLDLLTFPEDSPRQAAVDLTRQLPQAQIRALLRDLTKFAKDRSR
ncbi:MAG: helix-turn-helix domain-containing protein [Myxococcales bacterium]|nr:helix-turn-helix domain-containing protein [Myxococcales bacterium]